MLIERKKGFIALYALVAGAGIFAVFSGWFFLSSLVHRGIQAESFSRYSVYAGVLVLIIILETALNQDRCWQSLSGTVATRLFLGLRQTALLFVGLLLFLVASKDLVISRFFLFSFLPVIALTLMAFNVAFVRFLMPHLFANHSQEECLLIDFGYEYRTHTAEESEGIVSWLSRQGQYGIEIVGLLSPSDKSLLSLKVPYLGQIECAADLLSRGEISMLMLLQMPPQRNQMTHLIDLCERYGVRILVVHDLAQHFGRPMELTTHDGVHLVQFRQEPLQNPMNRLLKRFLDISVSLPVVVFILPPLALCVWILQRLRSPGPLFFTHGRNGRSNEIFQLYKFRTMHVSNDDVNRQASIGDSRIYSGAQLLRKTSLDEIPQFLNVLRGEMSVVGPRPHLPEHNRLWQEIAVPYNIRTFVRPGITGLAQTRGYRGEATSHEDILKRVECDLEYIERWSLLLDLWLILRTAKQVFFPKKTAY